MHSPIAHDSAYSRDAASTPWSISDTTSSVSYRLDFESIRRTLNFDSPPRSSIAAQSPTGSIILRSPDRPQRHVSRQARRLQQAPGEIPKETAPGIKLQVAKDNNENKTIINNVSQWLHFDSRAQSRMFNTQHSFNRETNHVSYFSTMITFVFYTICKIAIITLLIYLYCLYIDSFNIFKLLEVIDEFLFCVSDQVYVNNDWQ